MKFLGYFPGIKAAPISNKAEKGVYLVAKIRRLVIRKAIEQPIETLVKCPWIKIELYPYQRDLVKRIGSNLVPKITILSFVTQSSMLLFFNANSFVPDPNFVRLFRASTRRNILFLSLSYDLLQPAKSFQVRHQRPKADQPISRFLRNSSLAVKHIVFTQPSGIYSPH